MSFKLTEEQERIIHASRENEDINIAAGAGAGKTSTLLAIASDKALRGQRGLYLAFGKKVKEEAERRFPGNVTVKTSHGLAWTPEFGERMKAAGYSKPDRVADIIGIKSPVKIRDDAAPMKPDRIARVVSETVKNFCYSADENISVHHVPHVFGIESETAKARLNEIAVKYAKVAWRNIVNPSGKLKFYHDHYLKLTQLAVLKGEKEMPYSDFVLYDECQDTNPATLSLVESMARRGAQIISVGDSAQSIFEWRGAVDAMNHFPGKRLTLSKSFRFGPEVAEEANKYLDYLNVSELRVRGHEPVQSVIGNIIDVPDAILCRTNGGAMAEIMRLRDYDNPDIRIAVAGGAKEIKDLAEAALKLQDGIGCDHPDLMAFEDWKDLQYHCEEDPSLASVRRFVKLVDRYGPWALIFSANDMVDEHTGSPTVVVATGHRAKGLEFDRVRISSDFKGPEEDDNGFVSEVDPTELKLAYVAVTRAKHELDRGSLTWIDDLVPGTFRHEDMFME